jgi:hypothetical protein
MHEVMKITDKVTLPGNRSKVQGSTLRVKDKKDIIP